MKPFFGSLWRAINSGASALNLFIPAYTRGTLKLFAITAIPPIFLYVAGAIFGELWLQFLIIGGLWLALGTFLLSMSLSGAGVLIGTLLDADDQDGGSPIRATTGKYFDFVRFILFVELGFTLFLYVYCIHLYANGYEHAHRKSDSKLRSGTLPSLLFRGR